MSRARSVIAGFGSSQAKGVAIVGKKNTNLTLESSWEDRIVHGKIDSAAGSINVVSVYAPNITAAKETHRIYSKFLGELRKILAEVQGPISASRRSEHHHGPDPRHGDTKPKIVHPLLVEEWDDLKQAFGLYDVQRQLHPEERLFTFAPGGENVRGIFRRLDYVLCSKEILDTVEHFEARTTSISDHKSIIVTLRSKTEKPPYKMWKLKASLLQEPQIVASIAQAIVDAKQEAKHDGLDDRATWEYVKYKARQKARAEEKKYFKEAKANRVKWQKTVDNHFANPQKETK
jgi:exonuclease III